MLRGFRWQLLALVVAIGLFAISLATRSTDETPAPTAPPQANTPTPTVADNQPTATPGVSESPAQAATIPTYREALVGDVQRLNPLLAGLNPVDRDITSLVFEGLTRSNEYGEVIPALAKEWVVSFDGLEYVFILREDVLWQDGIPFTAADVLYTMSLMRSPDFPGPPELGDFWSTVETEYINDHIVRFRLPHKLGSFPEALRIGILPFHALQGTTAAQIASHPFNLNPIGTGPYQLEALRAGDDGGIQMVDLRAAPVYRQRPEGQSGYAVERLRFRLYDSFDEAVQALRDGEVDGYATRDRYERPPLLDLAGSMEIHTAYEPTTGMLIFNWVNDDVRFFREQRVRLALARGLDRTSTIERHLPNVAVRADSPFLPLSWANDGSLIWPPYDPEAAQMLLDTVNIQLESEDEEAAEGGEPTATPKYDPNARFGFTILTVDIPALVDMANEIAAQWQLLNLDVRVEAVPLATYRARLESAEFEAALVELSKEGSADPDVYAFWHQGQYPDGQNFGGVNDRAISEALERARREPNGTNRMIHYREFQREFIEEAIAIPLYYPLYTYVTTRRLDGVQLGFTSAPPDRFLTIKDWSLEGETP